MDKLLQDLRYGIRALTKAPGFTFVALLAIALGIGANTAIFSVVDAVLLRPLPFPESERLMRAFLEEPSGRTSSFGIADFLAWRDHQQSLEHVAAYDVMQWSFALTGPAIRSASQESQSLLISSRPWEPFRFWAAPSPLKTTTPAVNRWW